MKKLFAVLAVAAGLLAPSAARAELIVGVVLGNSLVQFDSSTPSVTTAPVAISGLVTGTEIVVGIDYRPADGQVVILTRDSNDGTGRVYTVNPNTAVATQINTLTTTLTDTNSFAYGIDFNPVPNALRIVNTADQNLRIAGGGAGATNIDTPLSGPGANNPTISAIAYDRNNPGVGVTTLYALDTPIAGTDFLRTIGGIDGVPSPNTGMVLDLTPPAPLNPNQTLIDSFIGFDISGATGVAYAGFLSTPTGQQTFMTVNLANGQTTVLGVFNTTVGLLVDFTVIPSVPEPTSLALAGVGAAGLLGYVRRRKAVATA